ncbi:hypothetical protein C1646_737962 [Rhizophagus diaphanus]|nr:hypothetical protein C1646_737962 [Rhizophagus diaphanus] [Rhizophagus sp. MUCL 43196]
MSTTTTLSTQVKGDTLEYEVKKKFGEINVIVHGVNRIYDLDTPSISQGMQLETYRSGIKNTSPVNKNISIAAIITTVYMVDFEDCNPGADWWASIAILPSEDLKCSSDEYDRETLGSYYDSLHLHPLIIILLRIVEFILINHVQNV